MGRRRTVLEWVPLYLAFAATGVGVALPGVLLPVLLREWRLADAAGGRLLFMAWMGSSVGALLVRGPLRRMLVLGSVAVMVGAGLLAGCGGRGASAWFALYGVGLGMVMTSVSLARQQQASGGAGEVGREMVRLNLVWALGASVCPALTTRALRSGNDGPVLYGLAAFFAVMALWCAGRTELSGLGGSEGGEREWGVLRRIPAALIVMTMLITGVEASAGGWLATYARRGGEGAVGAPTCLWVGLLLSRLFWSVAGTKRISQAWVVRGSLGLMMIAAGWMLAGGAGWGLLAAAAGLGVGIGPVYPLLLAWALKFYRGGAIFFLAGVGSAVLPWATGIVSTAQGSLRLGLGVPAAGVAVMLGLALVMPVRRWGEETSHVSS